MKNNEQWMQRYFDIIEKRLDQIDGKIDTLIRFKWQIVGGSAVVSAIITISFHIITRG